MTTDLVTWLRAQLDEDERVARVAGESWGYTWTHEPCDFDESMSEGVKAERGDVVSTGEVSPEQGEHIALWDPARVLAEVEAKRQLLSWVEEVSESATLGDFFGVDPDEFTVRMALPYAGRPGYLEERLLEEREKACILLFGVHTLSPTWDGGPRCLHCGSTRVSFTTSTTMIAPDCAPS